MQGIVENRKYRQFPWKRKLVSTPKIKKRMRGVLYKKGRVWTVTLVQQLNNLRRLLRLR